MDDPVDCVPPADTAVEMQQENYAFVMNIRRLQGVATYTLATGHELRKAKANEIAVIKETLAQFGSHPRSLSQFFWEYRLPHTGGDIERLPETEWRYFVIAFRGSNSTLSMLESALCLAPIELEVGFTILRSGAGSIADGMIWNSGHLFQMLDSVPYNDGFFVDISTSDLETIAGIHTKLQMYDNLLIDVKSLASRVKELKSLPHHSPLRFLGYFAILESLLTHVPKPTDPYDSLTRQIKKKVALLDHRWSHHIDYSPFGKASVDTVWSKMYLYRSQIAHGSVPKITSDLAVLGSHEHALTLVKETVKATIRQALEEPQLLHDLQEC